MCSLLLHFGFRVGFLTFKQMESSKLMEFPGGPREREAQGARVEGLGVPYTGLNLGL